MGRIDPTVVLFANEPPIYREAMCRAFREHGGTHASCLPPHATIDEGLSGARVVVTSGSERRARMLSRRRPVVNLSYDPRERAAVFRDGDRADDRPLSGLGDLVSLIEETLLAPG